MWAICVLERTTLNQRWERVLDLSLLIVPWALGILMLVASTIVSRASLFACVLSRALTFSRLDSGNRSWTCDEYWTDCAGTLQHRRTDVSRKISGGGGSPI
jgi:hypothetical protein